MSQNKNTIKRPIIYKAFTNLKEYLAFEHNWTVKKLIFEFLFIKQCSSQKIYSTVYNLDLLNQIFSRKKNNIQSIFMLFSSY